MFSLAATFFLNNKKRLINRLIAGLCDLLERVWAHGLQTKQVLSWKKKKLLTT